MKKVLFIVNHSAQLKAPFPLIQLLRERTSYQPVIFLSFSGGWNLNKELQILKDHQIPYILDKVGSEVSNNTQASTASNSPYISNIDVQEKKQKTSLKSCLIHLFPSFLFLRYNIQQLKQCQEVLQLNQIKAVVVPEDNYDIHYLMIRAARSKQIPTLLLPFTLSNHLEVLQTGKAKINNGILFKLYTLLFPKWKYVYKGNNFSVASISEMIILEILGLSPLQPFVLMGGRANYMLIEDQFSWNYFGQCNIQQSKMVLTGGIYQDIFYKLLQQKESFKQQLMNKYAITDSRPILVCNLFPVGTSRELKYDTFGTKYENMGDAIEFWLQPLMAAKIFQVWVNHHPRTNPEHVKFIESWDLKVIKEPIENILPLCDIYVTGVSATIRMALTCAKPVICMTEGYEYTDFKDFKSVMMANSKKDYLGWIKKLEDNQFYADKREQADRESQQFGPLDGKSFDRILKVFDSVLN